MLLYLQDLQAIFNPPAANRFLQIFCRKFFKKNF